jgi:hypothetical protein
LKEDRGPLDYTAALERVNDQLVVILKCRVQLLTEFKYLTPDPEEWEAMIADFHSVLETAETTREQKTLH